MLIPFSGIIKTVKTWDMFTSCVSLAAVKGDAGESSQSQMNALMMLLYGFLSSDILFGFFFYLFSLIALTPLCCECYEWIIKAGECFHCRPYPFLFPLFYRLQGLIQQNPRLLPKPPKVRFLSGWNVEFPNKIRATREAVYVCWGSENKSSSHPQTYGHLVYPLKGLISFVEPGCDKLILNMMGRWADTRAPFTYFGFVFISVTLHSNWIAQILTR